MRIDVDPVRPHDFGDGLLFLPGGANLPYRVRPMVPVYDVGAEGTTYVCDVCGQGFVVSNPTERQLVGNRLRPERWLERRRRLRVAREQGSGDYGS